MIRAGIVNTVCFCWFWWEWNSFPLFVVLTNPGPYVWSREPFPNKYSPSVSHQTCRHICSESRWIGPVLDCGYIFPFELALDWFSVWCQLIRRGVFSRSKFGIFWRVSEWTSLQNPVLNPKLCRCHQRFKQKLRRKIDFCFFLYYIFCVYNTAFVFWTKDL